MERPWSDEQRREQAEAVRRWQPWDKSTGPKTARGKARSCRNAYKGGVRPAMRRLSQELRCAAYVAKFMGDERMQALMRQYEDSIGETDQSQ